MPLLKEWKIGDHAIAAIWKIEEPESFFREHTGLAPDIKNERKRIEHLAGRFLLKHLKNDFPLHEIRRDEHNKPYIADGFFSVSHSWPFAAAVINPHEQAGIDIQTWEERIGRIQHKFLSDEEQKIFGDDHKLITMAWSAKEAVYKWHGKRAVEFIEDLPIGFFENDPNLCKMTIYFKLSKIPEMIFIENIINIDFTCSYVISTEEWIIY